VRRGRFVIPLYYQRNINGCVVMKIFKTKSFDSVGLFFLVGLVIEISFSSVVFACSLRNSTRSAAPATMNVRSGVTDSGSILGGWSIGGRGGILLSHCWGQTIRTLVTSIRAPSELIVSDGVSDYAVYPTNINNIGYIMNIRDHLGGDFVLDQTYTRTDPAWQDVNVMVRFVATGPLNPGTYNLSAREVLKFHWSIEGQYSKERKLSYSPATVTVTGATCSVLAADRDQQVVLPTVPRSSFQGVGSTAGLQRFTIGVNCPAGVALYATMTDANSPDNRGDFLTLAGDSTVAGVGLQITATDRANVVSYGADSRVAGNNNQWFVGGNATSPPTNHIIPFTVKYVQTAAAVQPGTVRARSTITFSYQ